MDLKHLIRNLYNTLNVAIYIYYFALDYLIKKEG